jgi:hypothetical protein
MEKKLLQEMRFMMERIESPRMTDTEYQKKRKLMKESSEGDKIYDELIKDPKMDKLAQQYLNDPKLMSKIEILMNKANINLGLEEDMGEAELSSGDIDKLENLFKRNLGEDDDSFGHKYQGKDDSGSAILGGAMGGPLVALALGVASATGIGLAVVAGAAVGALISKIMKYRDQKKSE